MTCQDLYSAILILLIVTPTAIPQNWQNRDRIGQRCPRGQVFLHTSGKCYPVGTRCPGLMKVYDIGGGYGACRCLQAFGDAKPLVFYRPHNRCYPIETRGPCAEFEVITQNEEDSSLGVCQGSFGAPGPSLPKQCPKGKILSFGECRRIVKIG